MKTTKLLREWLLPPKKSLQLYPNEARKLHTWILGQSGTGKTKFLESLIVQDFLGCLAGGGGVGVFDVHGDLFRHLTYYLAVLSARYPQLAERVVIIDPCDPDWVVSFNPLAAIEGMPQERVASFMSDVIVRIWQVNPAESPRMVWLMTNSFLALSDLGLTLSALPRFLQDTNWRNSLLPRLTHAGVRGYFTYEFPTSPNEQRMWITPVLNKLGPLVFDPEIKLLVAGNGWLNFRKILDLGLILLVHLPKGIIGEGAASLLGAMMVALLQKATLGRAASPYRPQFNLYLDEFPNYVTTHIQDVLSESRKFGLSLTLAHQFLAQIQNDELKNAIMNTTGTLIDFRIGYRDARAIVPEIFPRPDILVAQGITTWEGLALELANLPPRVFWLRRRGPFAPVRQRTRDMPDPVVTPQLEALRRQLLMISGQKYGRRKSELLAELEGQSPEILSASQRRRRRRKKQSQQAEGQSAMLEANDGQSDRDPDDLSEPTGGLDDDAFYL